MYFTSEDVYCTPENVYFTSKFAKLRLAARLHPEPLDELTAFSRRPNLAGLNGREKEGKMIGKGGEKMAWRREKVGPQIRNPTYFADYTARQNSIPVLRESCYTWFCVQSRYIL